ncbi:phosphotransferase [Actinoplanes derwentensis]|uniref:Phosphotransferase enzyme family protein n=1 Tax=Actinoplanes derwentensis TaxID=113562 RepID=A0A1H2BG61_9ACTN|nr:phosphotransferase [Actinoplanes derwentensis]GID87783.1 hypothetical protein Ade03nite_67070 [Actinoplanes derwentensis]SDT57067.1 Phosphotransferase enzyme family protein [Actinoplanes derwentensis]
MSEEELPGGNTVGAVRIDGVVHKRASPWTSTVHALLRHLEDAGFDGAPRALGFDEQGREMLTYLPGEVIGERVPWPGWAFADQTLVQVAQWLRRLHDLTADFRPPPDETWFAGASMGPGMVIGHQDAAPYNAVMDGDRLAGFFDWDTAGPSTREFDLAFAALSWVPLYASGAARHLGFPDSADRSRRLHLFLDSYGYHGDRSAFGAVVVQRARKQAAVIRRMAAAGAPAGTALLPVAGNLEQSADETEALPADFWTPAAVRGVVRFWHPDEGWGVIDADETPGGCWAFFGAAAMPGYVSFAAGDVVALEWAAPGQDGWPYRAVRFWPYGAEPVERRSFPGGAGYHSTLTLTFDGPDETKED